MPSEVERQRRFRERFELQFLGDFNDPFLRHHGGNKGELGHNADKEQKPGQPTCLREFPVGGRGFNRLAFGIASFGIASFGLSESGGPENEEPFIGSVVWFRLVWRAKKVLKRELLLHLRRLDYNHSIRIAND